MDVPWALKITSVDNGYILEWDENTDEDDELLYHREVIEESDHDPLNHHEKLLWAVVEFFGFIGSKHDPERLRIIRDKSGYNIPDDQKAL